MGGQVILEVMFYGKTYLTGGHVLQEVKFYGRTCLTGGHVLLYDVLGVNMSYRRSCFMGRHVLRGGHICHESL